MFHPWTSFFGQNYSLIYMNAFILKLWHFWQNFEFLFWVDCKLLNEKWNSLMPVGRKMSHPLRRRKSFFGDWWERDKSLLLFSKKNMGCDEGMITKKSEKLKPWQLHTIYIVRKHHSSSSLSISSSDIISSAKSDFALSGNDLMDFSGHTRKTCDQWIWRHE